MKTIDKLIYVFFVAILSLTQGCISTTSIEGIVDKAGKGIATVQMANTAKTLANTREIKAQTSLNFAKSVAELIDKQPIDKQSELISQSIRAKVDVANTTRLRGMVEASVFWLILGLIGIICKYIFDRYKPKIIKEIRVKG